ncbi:MAG: UDP-N-acetylmuramoyl-L-alanyl-D-glutamate--2,6-diaminopimelate ligase [Actinobacteria bacterium]|nr:UDP-N-acetylmuramoyl-L-alanyl-D-glutamate--2,6-diaminopimelate ligase [Actinomycetota bacterium]
MPSPRPASVAAVPLVEVARTVGAPVPPGFDGATLTGVTLDSRQVRPGDLYAALPGRREHGADHAPQAVAAGAAALLTDPSGLAHLPSGLTSNGPVPVLVVPEPRSVLGAVAALVYGDASDELTLVGITGTNGKTTTAYLLESALRSLGAGTGLIGTVETRVGDVRVPSVRTTPEAPDLHALFAVMREQGAATVVMEVSSHALAQHRVDGAVFDVALFTNLSQDHLDFHGTMEDYFAAKASLFTPEHARRGVVCVDDAWGARLAQEASIPVVTLASRLGVRADYVVQHHDHWPRFSLVGPTGTLTLQCHLPGEFNVVNTALAAVALLELGHTPHQVQHAMAAEPVVPGRMEVVTATDPDPERDPRCIVDYAHTPDAVEAALRALRPSTPGRLVVVLGAGGDRDTGKRRAMGAAAAEWADEVIVTDDNPRSEDPAAIRAELRAGAAEGLARSVDGSGGPPSLRGRMVAPGQTLGGSTQVTDEGSRRRAIAAAVVRGRQGRPASDNTVLVLGKGHETGQEIAGVVHAFDDRDALRAALDGLVYRPESD